MADTGWQNLTAFTSDGTDTNWSSPANAQLDDTDYAAANLDPETWTDYLSAQDASGVSVPTGATVDGCEVRLICARGGGAGNQGLYKDTTVQLIVGGVRSGSNLADNSEFSASFETRTFGGPTETWGLSLTPAIANASDTGWALRCYNEDPDNDCIGYIDHMQIKWYYTEADSFVDGFHTVL